MIGEHVAEKVTTRHLQRCAYLYVRQSTLRQVLENTTSTERQYGLRQRAVALGWGIDQVVVIDEDLGRSGASAEGREGFQRLVADVGMGKAGIVIGLEVSRLARNNADWHRLLEICALSETLILDEDGLYDPCTFNDRLLLGLKGQMSEAELHLLRARLRGGLLTKARRGELIVPLPIGFVYDACGRVMLDPDQGVREALSHLFAAFERTGSAQATVRYFNTEGLTFPSRVQAGPNKGTLVYLALRHHRVLQVLHNPRYAGAFSYGRRRQRRDVDGRIHQSIQPREAWITLIPNAHPGYINWERYERNLTILAESAQAHGTDRRIGPAREGPALLQGLVICGRCGTRMTVRYHTRQGKPVPDYVCQRIGIEDATAICAQLPGQDIDAAIGDLLLNMVTPLALDVSLAVQAELEGRAGEADALRRGYVERARIAAEQARHRYFAVDPENRLVAANLEADWNDALRSLSAAQEDYERRSARDASLGAQDKARILALASNFQALWLDTRTPQQERKRMVRLLIEDVTLLRDHNITVQIRFKGGQTTSLEVPVALPASQARCTPASVIAEIDRLLEHYTDAGVAAELNSAGIVSGTKKPFNALIISRIRTKYRLASRQDRLASRGLVSLEEAATRLGVCTKTVKQWHREGLIEGEVLDERNICLYRIPDHTPSKQKGRRLSDRARQGVALSPSHGRTRNKPDGGQL
ncbi:recombinase family protein [Ferrimicrobium acidiphilum]|uniref:recombinase family protein n=1 Tax=Ferrimicrobium acidiphilum TaxID=121039 RepID=UPI0023F01D45|nr:recombinase family protein [Ferrimicrobium acidiphilum]